MEWGNSLQALVIEPHLDYYLWANRALVGSELFLQHAVLVTIAGGRVQAVTHLPDPAAENDICCHPRFFSFGGDQTLLPALSDAHVHLALDGQSLKSSQELWDNLPAFRNHLAATARNYRDRGIGLLRDAGDRLALNPGIRSLIAASSEPCMPQVISTGSALRRSSGYGYFLGAGYRNLAELEEQVRAAALSGASQIKVIVSGAVDFDQHGFVSGKPMPAEELTAIVTEARRQGLTVMAHANADPAISRAVRAGVSSIEHGYYLEKETLLLMAEKEVAWVPTITPVAMQLGKTGPGNDGQRRNDNIRRICHQHLANLRLALELGVPLGIGSDAGAGGVPHASSLALEMQHYGSGDLDGQEVLRAATVTNARILGLEETYGKLAPGYAPLLLAVNGDPLRDLEVFGKPERIICPRQAGSSS